MVQPTKDLKFKEKSGHSNSINEVIIELIIHIAPSI